MPEPLTMSKEQERADRSSVGRVFGYQARSDRAYAEIDALRARLSEFDAAVEQASALIGSEYRNAGVIVAALDWQAARIAQLERERDALAAWSCADCGARFPQSAEAVFLNGVTRCSSCAVRDALRSEVERLRAEKDGAYRERNELAIALATMFGGRLVPHEGEPFEDGWNNVLIFDLPTGQVSFHIHASQLANVMSCPLILATGGKGWDGHTSDEKWKRFERFNTRQPLPAPYNPEANDAE